MVCLIALRTKAPSMWESDLWRVALLFFHKDFGDFVLCWSCRAQSSFFLSYLLKPVLLLSLTMKVFPKFLGTDML